MGYLRRTTRHATALNVSHICAAGRQRDIQKFYLAIGMVASVGQVNAGYLTNRARGSRRIVEYRRIAHYLSHVVMGLSMMTVARLSHRHHTSIIDTCHVIEERRDNPQFDKMLSYAELALIQIDQSLVDDAATLQQPSAMTHDLPRVQH